MLEASPWNRSFKILILWICVAKADSRDLHINLDHLLMTEMLVLFETILIGNTFLIHCKWLKHRHFQKNKTTNKHEL